MARRGGKGWLALIVFWGCLAVLALPVQARADEGPTIYAGWAVEAYPEASAPEMEALYSRFSWPKCGCLDPIEPTIDIRRDRCYGVLGASSCSSDWWAGIRLIFADPRSQ